MNLGSSCARAAGLVIFLVAVLALDVAVAGVTLHGVLIGLLVMVLMLPMGLQYIARELDVFEPLVMANVALGVMFIGRPLVDLATGRTLHLGYPIMPTFDQALAVALVGAATFQIGYHFGPARNWAHRWRAPGQFKPRQAFVAACVFFALGGALFAVFLARGGGVALLLLLLRGRLPADNAIYVSSTGYLYNGILMWSASALILFALAVVMRLRRHYLSFALVALPLVVFYGTRGTRSQLLPLVLAVPVFWFLWQRRRPSWRALAVAAVIGIALIGWQREIRSASATARETPAAALVDAFASPGVQIADTLNGADDEMFDSLANELLVVPSKLHYRPFGSIADLGIRAIPRPLWPGKPLEINNAVVVALWPAHYAASRGSTAFSILGPFYGDSGFIGVAIGMFLIGVFLGAAWQWYLRHRGNVLAMMTYSMGLPFVVILMRGTLPGTLSRMLFIVAPLVVLMALAHRWQKLHADGVARASAQDV